VPLLLLNSKTTPTNLFFFVKNTPKAVEIAEKRKKSRQKGAKKHEKYTNLQYKGY
jgi:hypothetical protein